MSKAKKIWTVWNKMAEHKFDSVASIFGIFPQTIIYIIRFAAIGHKQCAFSIDFPYHFYRVDTKKWICENRIRNSVKNNNNNTT